MREFSEDTIDLLVQIDQCLLNWIASVNEHVILKSIWMDSKTVLVGFFNESRWFVKVERLILVLKEEVVSWTNTMSKGRDFLEVILGDIGVLPEQEVNHRNV